MLYDVSPPEPPESLGAIEDTGSGWSSPAATRARDGGRVALTLRMVAGLSVPEIARAFLVQEAAIGSASPAPRPRSKRPASPTGCRPRQTSDPRVRRARRALPGLQRGLPRDRGRHGTSAARPDRRGDPADPPGTCPHARGRRGGRAAGADAAHRGPQRGPGLGGRQAGHARRAGPSSLGRGDWSPKAISWSRERLAPGRPRAATSPRRVDACTASARDVRADWSQVVASTTRSSAGPDADRRPQPSRRGRRARRPEHGIAAVDRLAEPLAGSTPATDPRRPATPAGTRRPSPRRVRRAMEVASDAAGPPT